MNETVCIKKSINIFLGVEPANNFRLGFLF